MDTSPSQKGAGRFPRTGESKQRVRLARAARKAPPPADATCSTRPTVPTRTSSDGHVEHMQLPHTCGRRNNETRLGLCCVGVICVVHQAVAEPQRREPFQDATAHEVHIEGTVRAIDGAALPGATLRLLRTGITTTSDEEGRYTLASRTVPRLMTIIVTLNNFSTQTASRDLTGPPRPQSTSSSPPRLHRTSSSSGPCPSSTRRTTSAG